MASRCDRIRDGHYAERSSDMDSGEFPVRDGHDSSVPTHGIPGVDLAGTNWPLYKLEALAAGVAVLVGALLVTGTAQTAVIAGILPVLVCDPGLVEIVAEQPVTPVQVVVVVGAGVEQDAGELAQIVE